MKKPFTYEWPATAERVGELYDTLSPIEELPEGVTREEFVTLSLEADATYCVLADGRLAGIAFVTDRPGHREMAFTKTEYLTTSRRLTFARHIPTLFANINWAEEKRLQPSNASALPPMYIHTPDGDGRSRDWFIRAGCTPDERGLRVPNLKEEP